MAPRGAIFTITKMKIEFKGLQGAVCFIERTIPHWDKTILDSCAWYSASDYTRFNCDGFCVLFDNTTARLLLDDVKIETEYGYNSFWVHERTGNPFGLYRQVFVFNDEAEAALFKLKWL